MKRWPHTMLTCLCCCAWVLAAAADTVFDMRSGLPENRIRAMSQMTDGRMAIATTATIEIFDGTRFHSFRLHPSQACPLPAYSGRRQLTCDSAGLVWLRYDRRLYVVDTRSGRVVDDVPRLLRRLGLKDADIAAWPVSAVHGGDTTAVVHDSFGGTWVGTREDGIRYTNPVRSRQFVTSADSFAHPRCPNFCSPRTSLLSSRHAPSATNCTLEAGDYSFLGTRYGVMAFDRRDSLVAVIDRGYGLLTDNIASLLTDHRGDVWVATAGGGLTRLHVAGTDSFDITNYGPPDGIHTDGHEFRTCQIHQDMSTLLVTVGFVGGVCTFHPDSVVAPRYTFHYPPPDSISASPTKSSVPAAVWLLSAAVAALAAVAAWLIGRRRTPTAQPTMQSHAEQSVANVVQTIASAERAPTADELFVSKLQSAIEQNISDEDFSVQSLSDMMAMDRTVLYRRMQQMGLGSPSVYIRQIRLKAAERLLRDTDMPMADIAMRTGFSTTKYFAAAFKEAFGKTPTQYRKTT